MKMTKKQLDTERIYWNAMASREKESVWYAVLDMQGGPIPTEALSALDDEIKKIAKKYSLAYTTKVE